MYYVTEDISEAIVNGCIGEVDIYPKQIATDIHFILTRTHLRSWRMIYYGKPNKRLCEMFNYDFPVTNFKKK